MNDATLFRDADEQVNYDELVSAAHGLMSGESDPIANAANLAALAYHALPRVNWLGFYFLRGDTLVVGPFQGQPACVRIPLGQGVCGTAAEQRRSVMVDDVHAFEGHIACDPASRSELVVPLLDGETLLGVLDIDSPATARFSAADQRGAERLAQVWVEACRAGA